MGTRTSIRPRPLDINKQLSIVRDVSELDSTEALQAAEAAEASQVQQKPKRKDIPVPEVRQVPTYRHDYLPLFKLPSTYIRGRGGTGWKQEGYVEYDLDNEDEDWLEVYNQNQNRLAAEKFEAMLWKLELACAQANERAHTSVDRPPEKMTPQQINSIDNLSREAALQLLRQEVGGREPVIQAAYQYWLQKRRRWGKPLMRRLQAPTSASDTNPFNVFRSREKVNRPQTRRRRENNEDCLDKMRMIRTNLTHAMNIVTSIVQREEVKRDLVHIECARQKLQLRLRTDSKASQEVIESEVLAEVETQLKSSREADRRRHQGIELPNGSAMTPADSASKPPPKRRKGNAPDGSTPDRHSPSRLIDPAKLVPEPDMIFTQDLDLSELLKVLEGFKVPLLEEEEEGAADPHCCRLRIGRGGRLLIDRCDPLTYDPLPLPSSTDPSTRPSVSSASMDTPQLPPSLAAHLKEGAPNSHPHHTTDKHHGRPPDASRAHGGPNLTPVSTGPGRRGGRGGGSATPAKRGPGRPPKSAKGGRTGTPRARENGESSHMDEG